MANLAEALPKELARVRALILEYVRIGDAGAIGAQLLELTLQRADQAIASGDVVAMLRAYHELQACE